MNDVVVVGASVAGAAAAAHLAGFGHRVRLIDRATFPRRKPCGEGLFPVGVRALDRLGVLAEMQPGAAVLHSLSLHGYRETATVRFDQARRGLGVRRDLLDAALLRNAESQGVDVALGVSATGLMRDGDRYTGVRTSQGDIEARVVVAAEGLGSRLRREAGLQRPARSRRYGVSAHFEASAPPEPGVDVYFQPGYEVYVTPVGASLVNVAVLLNAEMSRRLGGNLGAEFDAFVASAGVLRGARRIDEPLAAGPFPAQVTRRWRDNLVLAGDAAGFFDGITGEGMSLALVGAERCAAAVHAYLSDDDEGHLRAYDKAVVNLQRPSTLMARLSLALAARPRLGRLALRNLGRHPEVFARLAAISQGEAKLTSLRPRDVVALVSDR